MCKICFMSCYEWWSKRKGNMEKRPCVCSTLFYYCTSSELYVRSFSPIAIMQNAASVYGTAAYRVQLV
jgi:hypothetical protein